MAVLPPHLPPGMAPPTGVGAADCFSWDESINWQHNDPINKEEKVSKRKALFRKAGLTTRRKRRNPDLPPFVLRQVPYDVWRKHYAKDRDGNYRGTHAPAEDCLLKPDDVQKWRLGEPERQGDRWTRGKEGLPVYAEVRDTARFPEYEYDYDGPPRSDSDALTLPPIEELRLDEEDHRPASSSESQQPVRLGSASSGPRKRTASNPSVPPAAGRKSSKIIAEGKTAEEIIAEAEAKPRPKRTLMQTLNSGLNMTMGV